MKRNLKRGAFVAVLFAVSLGGGFLGTHLLQNVRDFWADLTARNIALLKQGFQQGQDALVQQMIASIQARGSVPLNFKGADGKPVAVVLIPKPEPKNKGPETNPAKK